MLLILREADKDGLTEAAKTRGLNEQTLSYWRKRVRGMEVAGVKELKALEVENGKLPQLVAEQMLALDVMKDLNARTW